MKTIRELQTSLPWTIRYSRDFRANPQPHKDFAHALVHVGKALGKLLTLVDDMDHARDALPTDHAKYLADLVVCALRAANTCPGGVVDLQQAVEERIAAKNVPLDLPVPRPPPLVPPCDETYGDHPHPWGCTLDAGHTGMHRHPLRHEGDGTGVCYWLRTDHGLQWARQ